MTETDIRHREREKGMRRKMRKEEEEEAQKNVEVIVQEHTAIK